MFTPLVRYCLKQSRVFLKVWLVNLQSNPHINNHIYLYDNMYTHTYIHYIYIYIYTHMVKFPYGYLSGLPTAWAFPLDVVWSIILLCNVFLSLFPCTLFVLLYCYACFLVVVCLRWLKLLVLFYGRCRWILESRHRESPPELLHHGSFLSVRSLYYLATNSYYSY